MFDPGGFHAYVQDQETVCYRSPLPLKNWIHLEHLLISPLINIKKRGINEAMVGRKKTTQRWQTFLTVSYGT